MSGSTQIDVPSVLDRVKKALQLTSDTQLAKHVEVSNKTVSSWRARNSLPIEVVLQAQSETGHSVEYFLFGQEPTKREPDFRFSDTRLRDFELAGISVFSGFMQSYAQEQLAFMSEEEVIEEGEKLGAQMMSSLVVVRSERRTLLDTGQLSEEAFDELIWKSSRGDLPHDIRAIRNRHLRDEGEDKGPQ